MGVTRRSARARLPVWLKGLIALGAVGVVVLGWILVPYFSRDNLMPRFWPEFEATFGDAIAVETEAELLANLDAMDAGISDLRFVHPRGHCSLRSDDPMIRNCLVECRSEATPEAAICRDAYREAMVRLSILAAERCRSVYWRADARGYLTEIVEADVACNLQTRGFDPLLSRLD